MRIVSLLLVVTWISACARPEPPALAPEPSRGRVECDVPAGLIDMWELNPVVPGTSALHAELTFEAARPHERWRPLVWVMLAEANEKNSVRVDLWQPPGWDALAVTARRIEGGAFTWHGQLAGGVAAGEARVVSLDWSHADRVEVRAGDALPALVPIDFAVRHVFAGCSGVKARLRLLDLPPARF
jgi:hypothetical protein